MKGLILAGGRGSRLYPLTQVASKQLQAVYDKPMIYYPLTVLIAGGIQDLCLVAAPEELPRFRHLLGDGSQWGVRIEYVEQAQPRGIAEGLVLAEPFLGGDPVAVILGDNLFFGGDAFPAAVASFRGGGTIFAYHVQNPGSYGVIEFNQEGTPLSLEEKPAQPRSNYAVPGVYLYDGRAVEIARSLKPSPRGELEITDVNRRYLEMGELRVIRLSRGFAWLDAGTSASLHEAASYVETIEKRQGMKLGCPEEAALRRGFLSLEQFESLVRAMPESDYRTYLSQLAVEARRLGLASA
jgi:glucose-1-phosphate thymidylyltransferase